MKHIKNFNSYKPVNEGLGLALLAGVGLAMAAPALYTSAKNFWSKNVVGSKYTETGNIKQVVCEFDEKKISPAVSSLTESERQSGKTTIELQEYEGPNLEIAKENKGKENKGKESHLTTKFRNFFKKALGNGDTEQQKPSLYYGYEHVIYDGIGKGALYRAMYKAEDWPALEAWLKDGKRYEGKGYKLEVEPVDLIYVSDVRNVNSSGTPISL